MIIYCKMKRKEANCKLLHQFLNYALAHSIFEKNLRVSHACKMRREPVENLHTIEMKKNDIEKTFSDEPYSQDRFSSIHSFQATEAVNLAMKFCLRLYDK